MKTIIALITFLAAFQVSAMETIKLPEGSSALTPIEGEVAVVYDMGNCPINTACLPSTYVNLNFMLNGCLDMAAVYTKVVAGKDGSTDIYVTALNVANEKSKSVMCFAIPTQQEQVYVGSGMISEESINVYFMGLE